jgi:hypothetical protein
MPAAMVFYGFSIPSFFCNLGPAIGSIESTQGYFAYDTTWP